jgi:hypothetical protein
MTTTKFSEGDRVRAYSSSGSIDGTVERIWTDNTVAVKPDNSSSVISYHPKQLRRLVKRKRVVWESSSGIDTGYYQNHTGGVFLSHDGEVFHRKLCQFIGKRVRIEITEAK